MSFFSYFFKIIKTEPHINNKSIIILKCFNHTYVSCGFIAGRKSNLILKLNNFEPFSALIR